MDEDINFGEADAAGELVKTTDIHDTVYPLLKLSPAVQAQLDRIESKLNQLLTPSDEEPADPRSSQEESDQ